jgi:hypothetical protein
MKLKDLDCIQFGNVICLKFGGLILNFRDFVTRMEGRESVEVMSGVVYTIFIDIVLGLVWFDKVIRGSENQCTWHIL